MIISWPARCDRRHVVLARFSGKQAAAGCRAPTAHTLHVRTRCCSLEFAPALSAMQAHWCWTSGALQNGTFRIILIIMVWPSSLHSAELQNQRVRRLIRQSSPSQAAGVQPMQGDGPPARQREARIHHPRQAMRRVLVDAAGSGLQARCRRADIATLRGVYSV